MSAASQVKDNQPRSRPSAPSSGDPFPAVPEVIFANWREALRRAGLSPGIQAVCSLAHRADLSRMGLALRGLCQPARTRNGDR